MFYNLLTKKTLILTLMIMMLVPLAQVQAESKEIIELKKIFKGLVGRAPETIKASQLPGIYEVVMGSQIMYVSKDGRYLLQGDLFDIKTNINLTENTRSEKRVGLLNSIKESDMIVFKPRKANHRVTVFTDIDCGYCRKLHREMDSYLKEGIEVRYLAFPRSGPNSKSYYKAVTVWCSDDRQKAMTEAKSGKEQARKDCVNPVKDQFELGQAFGVTGTPSIVLDNGELVPGYVPAERLKKILEERSLSL